MKIYLQPEFFTNKETILAKHGDLSCSLFTYNSGVKAARLSNRYGYIIILPYMGQMIWDVCFNERSIKMKSFIEEPVETDDFLETYGCFLMHCGALRMGCPGPLDTHRLHGELPVAKYNNVHIILGTESDEKWLEITGEYVYKRAFGDYYNVRPALKLYENRTIADLAVEIKNCAKKDMELMYMAHINYLPEDGAKIYQPACWTDKNMRLRKNEAAHLKTDSNLSAFFDRIAKDPEYTQFIREDDAYDPEAIFYIYDVSANNDGYAEFIQEHTDGSSDYLSYNIDGLGHCVRQLIITPDQQSLGLALPATCEPEGYLKEREKGNVKILKPDEKFTAKMKFGVLDKSQTEKKIKEIENSTRSNS